jgi:hypothetical protein
VVKKCKSVVKTLKTVVKNKQFIGGKEQNIVLVKSLFYSVLLART